MKLTFRDAINRALDEEMARDEKILITGEDVSGGATIDGFDRADAWGGVFGVTRDLVAKYGRSRVIDTPISESAFIGCAIGASAYGYRTVTELQFLDFMGVCLDQIANQAAKLHYAQGSKGKGFPLVIRAMIGAGVRSGSQQAQSLYSVVAHFPGLKVVTPATPADAYGLMKSAIRDDDPVIFLENKGLYETSGEVPDDTDFIVPIGRADVVREGEDVTIVSIARMRIMAMEAAEDLARRGASAEVIDVRTVAPLDYEAIARSVRKTGRLVVVDEDTPRCSVASDILGLIASREFSSLKAAPQMVTAPHTPVPFAPQLEDFYIPDAAQIVTAARAVLAQG